MRMAAGLRIGLAGALVVFVSVCAQAQAAAKTPSTPGASANTAKAKERQAQCAKSLGVPVEVVNSIGMRFVLIPSGEFDMGSSDADIKRELEEQVRAVPPAVEGFYFDRVLTEGPLHRVKISKPFYLGACEVTQGEYMQIMQANPSLFSATARGRERRRIAGTDASRLPVENVTWDEAMEFAKRLSALPAEQQVQRTYRLPTEAEWEYACRADTTTRWFSGDEPSSLLPYAWFKPNAERKPHPVGGKLPNAWGLFDMHGNVFEWCADHFATNYYGQSVLVDPKGPTEGTNRVARGGEWGRHPWGCRSAYRAYVPPSFRAAFVGFRICYGLEQGVPAAATTAPMQNAVERMRQVRQLYSQGLISKEGFDKKVKAIAESL